MSNDKQAGAEVLPRYAEAVAVVKEQQRASVSLVQRRLRISWNAARDLIELMLDRGDVPLDWAPPVYQLAARRAAPVAEGVALPPLDAEGLPELPKAKCLLPGVYAYTAEQVRQAQREAYVAGAQAASKSSETRMDTGFHGGAHIQTQPQQAALPPKQSIGDDYEFQELAGEVYNAGGWNESMEKSMNALIAHIDGRTAGTAPAGWAVTKSEDTFLGTAIRVSNPDVGFATLRPDGRDPSESVLFCYFDKIAAAPSPLPPKEEAK
jgi:hypothetical protein